MSTYGKGREMKNMIITVGHNVGGVPTHSTARVCAECCSTLGVDGITAIPCMGVWRGEVEESTRVEIRSVSDDEAARIWALLPELAERLGQVEVMAEVKESETHFIAASIRDEKKEA